MQNIRNISGAGGVFHIFVPGVFFLLNLIGCIYLFPYTDDTTRQEIEKVFGNPSMGLIITIGFGYLIGVILRIFRSERSDQWSARFLQRIDKTARLPESDKNYYAYEAFPYMKWMGQVCRRLPTEVETFYKKVWSEYDSKTFLNFAKLIVISEDERAANEIYAVESLCRYISGMLYALLASIVLTLIVIVSDLIHDQTVNALLGALLIGYAIAFWGILHNFRFMRIKEVQTVLYASYKNKDAFEEAIDRNSHKKKES